MAIRNPIQFTSRTFNTVLNDINSDPELVDKPNWFKRIWAGIADVFSIMINATANNLILRTSFTRQNTIDLLELINYYLNPQSTSDGNLIFYLSSSISFPFTISRADLSAQTSGGTTASTLTFESRLPVTVNETSEGVTAANVDDSTDIFTVTRDYTTGEKVILAGADLPAPLVAGTEYWVIRTSATQIKLATSLVNAYAGVNINLTDAGTSTHTVTLYSILVQCYQQESQESRVIGTSDGATEFQDFTLGETDILEDTISIEINSVSYTKVDSLVFSDPTDTHYEVIYDTNNVAIIRFGNDTYGIVPPAFDINAEFAIGGGNNSNVGVIDRINIYSGSNTNIVGVSNPTTLTGGSASEDTESGKRLGPLLLKTRDSFITSLDGASLAEDFGGVSQVIVNGNEFGLLSAEVVIIPQGGGNSSAQFKTDLQTHLIDRTVLESIDVRVVDATYLTQNVTSAIKVSSGFVYADIEPYVDIAFRIFFSETGLQIQRDFESNGIASATILVNSIFGTSFIAADYTQLQNIIENLNPRIIGVDVQQSDTLGFIDSNVDGVDFLTISIPTFPISVGSNEITTDGTITLSEIT